MHLMIQATDFVQLLLEILLSILNGLPRENPRCRPFWRHVHVKVHVKVEVRCSVPKFDILVSIGMFYNMLSSFLLLKIRLE